MIDFGSLAFRVDQGISTKVAKQFRHCTNIVAMWVQVTMSAAGRMEFLRFLRDFSGMLWSTPKAAAGAPRLNQKALERGP